MSKDHDPDGLLARLIDALELPVCYVDSEQRYTGTALQRIRSWWAAPPRSFSGPPGPGYHLGWQFLFPSSRWSRDPATRRHGRYHLAPSATQRKMKEAARSSGITKPVSCHTLRRSFATEMLRSGYDVRSVQKLMGHNDIRTTMIYVQAITDAGLGIRSPLDRP